MGCTGNGGINLPKALEFVFNNGADLATGEKLGAEIGEIETYEHTSLVPFSSFGVNGRLNQISTIYRLFSRCKTLL